MNFSEALIFIRNGRKLSREGWNGKGMFVYLVPGHEFVVNRAPLNEFYREGTKITYNAHIDIRCADGHCSVWTPTMYDLLADDWACV